MCEIPSQILTFKRSLRLENRSGKGRKSGNQARRQHEALAAILEQQRLLYNAALAERVEAYRRATAGCEELVCKSDGERSYYVRVAISDRKARLADWVERHGPLPNLATQTRALTALRAEDPEFAGVSRRIQAATLRRLDAAYDGFYRRVRRGQTPGFPRFKGRDFWNSFGFDAFRQLEGKRTDGGTFDGRRISFRGVPGKLRISEPLPQGARVLNLLLSREGRRWYACFQCRVPVAAAPVARGRVVGVDCGVRNTLTLSTGHVAAAPKHLSAALDDLREASRAVSVEKKGSRKRRRARERLARLHRKIRNRRATYLHKQAKLLVTHHQGVVLEALAPAELAQQSQDENQPAVSKVLNRHLADAAPFMLRQMVRYKSVRHGARYYEVDPPRGTAQECAQCGAATPCPPGQEKFVCASCGSVAPRNYNTALVLLKRAHTSGFRGGPAPAAVSGCEHERPERGRPMAQGVAPVPFSRAREHKRGGIILEADFSDTGWS